LSVLVTATSATGSTVVVAKAVLFPKLGSLGLPALTSFVRTVPSGTAELTKTTSVIVADAPSATGPIGQVTKGPAKHDPCEGVAKRSVVPFGKVSIRTTNGVSDGPVFVTVIV
jgi:hypothetical protein